MNESLAILLSKETTENYIHPFTRLSVTDTYDSIEKRLQNLKAIGISSMNLLWSGHMKEGDEYAYYPFNSEQYWTRIGWVAELCNKYHMTFMMQDAAPFPTGNADGWLQKEEYLQQNKLYIGERHLDVRGPQPEAAFLISDLIGALRSTDQDKGFGKARPFPGDRLYAVVAVQKVEGILDYGTAVDLTDEVSEGILSWPVPEGIWRLFVLFETMNDGGRIHYINMLDKDSVSLHIHALYESHYEHLKSEIGKTWLGLFYDEAEIGNLYRYNTVTLPGAARNMEGESMALPWSREFENLWRNARGEDYRRELVLLWDRDASVYHRVRYVYMDMVTRLACENFNGQVHKWCKEHGLLYIGHVCEDENTHCALANGPGHFYRFEKHQDAAGIDLIGGQLMPKKDFIQAWYGCPEGDGEFYHYGIAKLASSEAHINPNKKGRSFCEVFAVYGDIAGPRLRKYVYDHLMINGINEMIPSPPYMEGFDIEISRNENNYVNRICRLLHETKPVIKVAVLYHAEAEWYQLPVQRFQKPCAELARHQISYDVIPSDVFSDIASYNSDFSSGLTINGNIYEALVIPAVSALPECVVEFLKIAESVRFPVFFCDRKPEVTAESGRFVERIYGDVIANNHIAEVLSRHINRDICLLDYAPDLRCAHFTNEDGEWYYLLNEGKKSTFTIQLAQKDPIYAVDPMNCMVYKLPGTTQTLNGREVTITMEELESLFLFSGDPGMEVAERKEGLCIEIEPQWHITLEDGKELDSDTLFNINGAKFFPRYTGMVTYEADICLESIGDGGVPAEAKPHYISFGEIYESCEFFLNGESVGKRQCSPYTFDIRKYIQPGKNHLCLKVQLNKAREISEQDNRVFGKSMSASVYNALSPGGLLGPVHLYLVREYE